MIAQSSIDEAYHAGWDAGVLHIPQVKNPYAPGTFERSSWDFGYTLATQGRGDPYYGRYEIRRK